jgi:hypothetical protein
VVFGVTVVGSPQIAARSALLSQKGRRLRQARYYPVNPRKTPRNSYPTTQIIII